MINENTEIFYSDNWVDYDEAITFEIIYYNSVDPFLATQQHATRKIIKYVNVEYITGISFTFSLDCIVTIGKHTVFMPYYDFIIENLAYIFRVDESYIRQRVLLIMHT